MFARKAFVAGALGIVATVGWTLQGVGNAYYFRKVYIVLFLSILLLLIAADAPDMGTPQCRWSFYGKGQSDRGSVGTDSLTDWLSLFKQAKSELATHGAKAYFTRG